MLARLEPVTRGGWSSRLVWMAALVPLFFAAVLPAHVTNLVCRFSGVMMEAEACCPPIEDSSRDEQARLQDEACCSTIVRVFHTLVSNRRIKAQSLRTDQPADVAPVAAAAAAGWGRRVRSFRGPAPSFRPPPLVLKRCLLI